MSEAFPVIDFHSHILPELDHGCASSDEACEQLKLMQKYGTNIVVATSHFYPDKHDANRFISASDAAVERLLAKAPEGVPQIILGAEVLLCPNLHTMEGFERLCIRGTKVMLLELPHFGIDLSHYDTVEAIIGMGITVVLAHIDRYFDKPRYDIDELLSMGALAQVNAYSLSSAKIRKQILSYLETTDKICALGSDLHGIDSSRYKKFAKAPKLLPNHFPTIMNRSKELLKGVI